MDRTFLKEHSKMQFTLRGFTQEMGSRVYAFERTQTDRIRTAYTVRADLSLIRTYNIPMQELPLLCQSLLERRADDGDSRALTFTEEEMSVYANDRATARLAAAQKRKPPRKPLNENRGAAWRGPVHAPPPTTNE
jgi:hypothetical protein